MNERDKSSHKASDKYGFSYSFTEPRRDDPYTFTKDKEMKAIKEILKEKDLFASDMWDVLDEAGNLLITKHEDYGPLNISRSPGGPLNGLRVRIWDKIARINNLIDSGTEPEHESLRDSFIDLLNYSAIALMVIDHTWPALTEIDCE